MAPDFNTIDDLKVEGKTVLVRVDINSPVDPLTGLLLDDTRIRLHAETIAELADKGAKTVLIAHQSRPGKKDFTTLQQHAEALSNLLDKSVGYVDDIFGSNARKTIKNMEGGDILLLENVRFYPKKSCRGNPPQLKPTMVKTPVSPG